MTNMFVPANVPLNNYPGQLAPYSNTTPFTDRDLRTFQGQLEGFIAWLTKDVTPHYDGEYRDIIERLNDFTTMTAAEVTKYEAYFDDANKAVTEAMELAKMYAAQTEELQSAAVSAILTNKHIIWPSPGRDVDAAPALQALIDSGVTSIRTVPGDVYFINGPIFIDGYAGVPGWTADPRLHFTFDGTGSIVLFGPNAGAQSSTYGSTTDPGVSWNGIPYKPERSTRHVFWMNTKRTAYNPTTGIVTDPGSNAATGKYNATVGLGLVFIGMDVRYHEYVDRTVSVRVMLLNNTTGKYDGRTSYLNGIAASVNYCDSNNFQNARLTNPSGYRPSILKQGGNGDGLVISANTDARALLADLNNCNGAYITGVGGGIRVIESTGIHIDAVHIEGDESLRVDAPIYWTRSSGEIDAAVLWAPIDGKHAFQSIIIADGTAKPDIPSNLTISNLFAKTVYRPDAGRDERAMPDVMISSLNDNSRIRFVNSFSYMQPDVTDNAVWRMAPWIVSSDTDIQAALDAGAALIATGNFELRRSGGWRVVPLVRPELQTVAAVTVAPLWSAGSVWAALPGSLLSGSYDYYMASIDDSGVIGPRSLVRTIVVSSGTGASTRLIIATTKPGRVAIWRGPSSPVAQFRPDAYTTIAVPGVRTFIHDTGENVNRRPWSRANIPALPDSAVPGPSVAKLIIDGKSVTLS